MSLCRVNKRGSIVNNQGDHENSSLVDLFSVQTSLDQMNSLRDKFDTFRTSRRAIQRRQKRETISRRLSGQVPDSLHPDERRLPFFSRMCEDLVSTEQEWNDWFASFKRQHRRGHFDAIFVQETHTKANELTRSRVTTRLTWDIEQV